MVVDQFWNTHLTMSEAARKLGCSRQNIKQRVSRGSIPSASHPMTGIPGIPIQYVQDEIQMKGPRDVVVNLTGMQLTGDLNE